MNRVFQPRGYFTVPDGTEVSAFLNATDATQGDVPWGALGQMSLASGVIRPKSHSWVHVHRVVRQVTYLVTGALSVRMKEPGAAQPYELALRPGQAVLTLPHTFFQLRNDGEGAAEVLYMVSPSYVFEMSGGQIVYDDATVVAKSWEDFDSLHADPAGLKDANRDAKVNRSRALRRLKEQKGRVAVGTDLRR